MPPLLEVNLKPSVIHWLIVFGICGSALISVWCACCGLLASMLLSLMIVIYGGCYLYRVAGLKGELCISGIRFYNDCWWLKTAEGWNYACPGGQAFVGSHMMFLPFKYEGAKRSRRGNVLIFPDSVAAHQRHGLRLSIVLNGFSE
ncbi:MAG: hypothetical protein QS721_14700 [Candidatus Endonucleobacter sp. (ex Gigantidas childressi)]|nr:hypothetical protein [Candidatus Endonucleobacter sp. (ex Gigantidas childressi)]